MKKRTIVQLIGDNLLVVIGLVLIWRGIWYVLDGMDMAIFGGGHALTSIGGIILGLLLLYLPDKNLDEIQKL